MPRIGGLEKPVCDGATDPGASDPRSMKWRPLSGISGRSSPSRRVRLRSSPDRCRQFRVHHHRFLPGGDGELEIAHYRAADFERQRFDALGTESASLGRDLIRARRDRGDMGSLPRRSGAALVRPVAESRTTTDAPGRAAPEESTTRPCSPPRSGRSRAAPSGATARPESGNRSIRIDVLDDGQLGVCFQQLIQINSSRRVERARPPPPHDPVRVARVALTLPWICRGLRRIPPDRASGDEPTVLLVDDNEMVRPVHMGPVNRDELRRVAPLKR